MVFCKLSDNIKKKLNDTDLETEIIINKTKDNINTSISNTLKNIDENKKKLTDKLLERKQKIEASILQPYKVKKSKNRAIMFVIDVSLMIFLGLFIYRSTPLIKKYFFKEEKYTKEQLEEAMKLPESAYSKEQLRKAQEFRKSYMDWLMYYKNENAFSDDNLGKPEIIRGNMLRSPFLFILQYVIPYIIVAYIIWFIIKYIKYVIAAIWGFFIACYQFVTAKITCKLAEKWYIRMVTGWSRCSPSFGGYMNSWKNNYIVRPLAEERISYLRAVEQAKVQYKQNQSRFDPLSIGKTFWDRTMDRFRNFKLMYIDLPLNELYLQLTDFHPNYVVKPYSQLGKDLGKKSDKLKGDSYESKTKSGKVCKCPPRKTVYKKLNQYLMQELNNISDELSEIPKKTKEAISSITDEADRLLKKARFDKLEKIYNKLNSCDTYDAMYDKTVQNRKTIAKVIWILLFILTFVLLIMSIFFTSPGWIKALFTPVYQFTNSYVPAPALKGFTIGLIISYSLVFSWLGYYSFIK